MLVASVLAGVDTAAGQSYQAGSGIALTVIGVATAAALGLVAAGAGPGAPVEPHARAADPAVRRHRRHLPAAGPPARVGVCRAGAGGAGFATLLVPPSLRALTGQQARVVWSVAALTRAARPAQSSAVSPSRSWASVLASSRDTCIWEMPSSLAICDWVMLPKNRSSRIRFSRDWAAARAAA